MIRIAGEMSMSLPSEIPDPRIPTLEDPRPNSNAPQRDPRHPGPKQQFPFEDPPPVPVERPARIRTGRKGRAGR
jgi:hypothetical protein